MTQFSVEAIFTVPPLANFPKLTPAFCFDLIVFWDMIAGLFSQIY
jgi:hypothetical protein